jgi:uncharacterized RDD family membrane protein YckC
MPLAHTGSSVADEETRSVARPGLEPEGDAVGEPGLLARRLGGGLIDAALLMAINAVVVWLTLRSLELTMDDWRIVPLVPLGGFLFLLNTSYLVTFTAASGQTMGQMATGVRTRHERWGRVPFGHAVLRSVALLLCAIPAGIGLLPIVFGADARGLHDRLAGTRVVGLDE